MIYLPILVYLQRRRRTDYVYATSALIAAPWWTPYLRPVIPKQSAYLTMRIWIRLHHRSARAGKWRLPRHTKTTFSFRRTASNNIFQRGRNSMFVSGEDFLSSGRENIRCNRRCTCRSSEEGCRRPPLSMFTRPQAQQSQQTIKNCGTTASRFGTRQSLSSRPRHVITQWRDPVVWWS